MRELVNSPGGGLLSARATVPATRPAGISNCPQTSLRGSLMIIPFAQSRTGPVPRDHLLIACMPKSGSTYLHTVLREITGLGDASLGELGDQNEGDICSADSAGCGGGL